MIDRIRSLLAVSNGQERRIVYLVGQERIDFLQARYHYRRTPRVFIPADGGDLATACPWR